MAGLEAGVKVRKESRTPRFLAWENGCCGWWVMSFTENGNIRRDQRLREIWQIWF